jgi:cytoskeletal protein CcmA (bactofilin family)
LGAGRKLGFSSIYMFTRNNKNEAKEKPMGLLTKDEPSTSNYRNNSTTPSTTASGFNAILDRGSEFEGKLTFEGTVRIDGKFKGDIFSESHMVIGESGRVEGTATVGSVSISGNFNGDIRAKAKVELHKGAVVKGDIYTPSLTIEDGVKFDGRAIMDSNSLSKELGQFKNTTSEKAKVTGLGITASA